MLVSQTSDSECGDIGTPTCVDSQCLLVCRYWDVCVAPDGSNLTETIRGRVKEEIITILVSSFVVAPPDAQLEASRRSNRLNTNALTEVQAAAPSSSKRSRVEQVPNVGEGSESSSDDDESNAGGDMIDDEDAAIVEARRLFDLGILKRLWSNGDEKEVGRRQIALLAAHEEKIAARNENREADEVKTRKYANYQLNRLAFSTYSVKDFGCIFAVDASTLGNKIRSFEKLIDFVNKSARLQIRAGQLIAEWLYDVSRYNEGVPLIADMFEPTGPRELKSEAAFILRHIKYTFPKIGTSKMPELLVYMHVLLGGKAPDDQAVPSAATIRSNNTRLNSLDEHGIREEFRKLSKDLSPCGNLRKIGLQSDATKHGKRDKVQVIIFSSDDGAKSNNRDSTDLKERYSISPKFVLGTTSPSPQADAQGHSNLNIDIIKKLIPREALCIVGGMATDNANDAMKEQELTESKFRMHLRDEGLHEETRENGVERWFTRLGDFFHVDQLLIKWLSEGVCGKTDGDFDQTHHRRVSSPLNQTI